MDFKTCVRRKRGVGGGRRADTKDLLETNVAGALGSAGTGLSELPSTTWQEAQA